LPITALQAHPCREVIECKTENRPFSF
jgi:hypothetical protein